MASPDSIRTYFTQRATVSQLETLKSGDGFPEASKPLETQESLELRELQRFKASQVFGFEFR